MPAYYDKAQKTWYCKFYYVDWTGTRKQKLKRGFKLQRDAKDWERNFIERQAGSPGMTFGSLYDLYLEDISSRIKLSTIRSKRHNIERHILPYFKNKPINEITPGDIRKWQNNLISGDLKPTTLRYINSQLNAILNFAMKYYGLLRNPCKVAGVIGKSKADRMAFWTHDEFKKFISCVENPKYKMLYTLLYYTGLRCGEALALTPADIDFEKQVIHVTKTYHRIKGEDIITSPKAPNSVRSVLIPKFLCEALQEYMNRIYGIRKTDFLFPSNHNKVGPPMKRACNASGVKQIRVHDLRHSHVSLLINMGFPAMLIAERIGDTVNMVNTVYGHLYPNQHEEVAMRLQNLVSN